MRRLLFPLLMLSVPCAARAQQVRHVTATEIRDSLAGARSAPGRMLAKPLGDRGSYSYIAVRRDQTGEVEIHAGLDDVIVVQEGVGTLLSGGRVAGDRETGPGERRGGQLTGGTTRTMAPGDLAIVPAGVPHQLRVEPGGSITYLVVKVAPPAAARAAAAAPRGPGE